MGSSLCRRVWNGRLGRGPSAGFEEPDGGIDDRGVQKGDGEFDGPLADNERGDGHDAVKSDGDENHGVDELRAAVERLFRIQRCFPPVSRRRR